jgi:hypothetical protein
MRFLLAAASLVAMQSALAQPTMDDVRDAFFRPCVYIEYDAGAGHVHTTGDAWRLTEATFRIGLPSGAASGQTFELEFASKAYGGLSQIEFIGYSIPVGSAAPKLHSIEYTRAELATACREGEGALIGNAPDESRVLMFSQIVQMQSSPTRPSTAHRVDIVPTRTKESNRALWLTMFIRHCKKTDAKTVEQCDPLPAGTNPKGELKPRNHNGVIHGPG